MAPDTLVPVPDRSRWLTLAWLASGCGLAQAQPAAWPSRPVRMLVGYPAGGLADAMARAYGEALATQLGQPVVVDNRPGAAGMLAGAELVRSGGDGHTFWWTLSGTVNQNRVLYRKMPYDPDRDFVHVAGFDPGPSVMAVPADSPLRTVNDVLAHGRRQVVTIGNYAPGSHPHMMAQQLSARLGLNVDQVPYKGEAPMWVDVAAGHIMAGIGSPLGVMPHLRSGRVRAIAVTTRQRSRVLPDVPTFEEQGLSAPVFQIQGWIGVLAPAQTPPAVVQRLSQAIGVASASPRVQQLHQSAGFAPQPWTAAEFARMDLESRPMWIALAQALNLTLD